MNKRKLYCVKKLKQGDRLMIDRDSYIFRFCGNVDVYDFDNFIGIDSGNYLVAVKNINNLIVPSKIIKIIKGKI